MHPLDPLNQEELRICVELVREHLDSQRILFEHIRLLEPKNPELWSTQVDSDQRTGFAVVLDRESGKTYEAVVDITDRSLQSLEHVPDVQCCVTFEECAEMAELVKSHPEFVARLKGRGIDDPQSINVDMFSMGNFASPEERHKRLLKAHCFYVENPGDNGHVRPIEGLVPVVDLNTMEVLRVEDYGSAPVPGDKGHYKSEQMESMRPPLAALEITQPNGPGFRVDGYGVSWENWKFRVGFTPKEGLVLHTLSFNDGGIDRPIINRASLSELVVPYADTAGDHGMNHSFDLGEGVFGSAVNSLKLGCDCLGEIHYFDVDMADALGNVQHYPNVVCLHEEDYGILWKHSDLAAGTSEVRRSRRLVISSFFTIGNYDYGLFWYLYLDGTIEFEAKLTGMLYTRAMKHEADTEFGTEVAPGLNGMIHEHYFNVRLDMAVDGEKNSVVEVEANRICDPEKNPLGNAHGITQMTITNERDSGRDTAPQHSRYWKILSESQHNGLGQRTAYKLVPGPNIKPMHQPDSAFMRRAGFVAHDLWITAYDPKQIHAPGDYVNQNEFGPGLPEWTQAYRDLENQDIVLWHTVGLMHVPRPEDYPVMPVEYVGFMLKPFGFFDRNPTLNLAPPPCHSS